MRFSSNNQNLTQFCWSRLGELSGLGVDPSYLKRKKGAFKERLALALARDEGVGDLQQEWWNVVKPIKN
jgi:hypothetical protein